MMHLEMERFSMERFWKAHGLGNDYLVWKDGLLSQSNEMTAERVVQICDRHRGLGSDGVLEPKVFARRYWIANLESRWFEG